MKCGWIAMGCAALGVCVASVGELKAQMPVPSGATLVADGLIGPRGLKFGPDGSLYVALAGPGGTNSTADICPDQQVAGADYTNGDTASIVKIDKSGNVTTVASGFPSALSQRTPPDVLGLADVAFLDGHLYALESGGGCSHGASLPNMVAQVDEATHSWTMLADLSAAVLANPPAAIPLDYEADGVFYNLIVSKGQMYAVESNHGKIWSVTKKGEIEMVTDIAAQDGHHIVPTAAVESDGGLFVGNLGLFPISPDSSQLLMLRPGCGDHSEPCGPGTLHIAGSSNPGLTTVVAMDWGPDGLLYVLELSEPQPGESVPYFPNPGDGKVVRVRSNGQVEDVITGLSLPTGMTFGPNGALYVSNWGAAAPAPIGQILRYSNY